MKRTLTALAIAALAAVVPAHATVFAVSFSGIVYQTHGATGQSAGSVISGHFDLDSVSGHYLDFTIAGKSVAAGYTSSASIGPALDDALYTAQVSPVSAGTPSNSTFSLDLSALTSWPTADTPYSLLTATAQLTTNLDTINNPLSAFPSTFNYYTASSTGTNIVALKADLTSITAVATPEPSSLALLASSLLGLGFLIRRRA
jgi:hypothetical protein